MRSPCNGVDAWIVVRQCCQSNWGSSDVNQVYTRSIHCNGCNVVGVDLVPCQSQEGRWWRGFVYDSGVVQVSLVKNSHWAVGPNRSKKTVNMWKRNVVHGLVMCDELRFNLLLLQIPYGAGCIDWGSPQLVMTHTAPVKWRQWRQVCRLLLRSSVCKLCNAFHLPLFHLPEI